MTAVGPWFVTAPPPPIWPEGLRRELPCQRDPDAWHPPGGHVPAEVRDACAVCPRRVECLAWALEAGPEFGVWGGYSARDVDRLRDGRAPLAQLAPESAPEPAPEDLPRPACDCTDDMEHRVSRGRWVCRVRQREYSRNARRNAKARAELEGAA